MANLGDCVGMTHTAREVILASTPAGGNTEAVVIGSKVSEIFWPCSERLSQGRHLQAAGCHHEARTVYMDGFRSLLGAYSHVPRNTSHHVPRADTPGALSISWSLLFLMKSVSCSWALADHEAVIVTVTSILVLVQHLSQRHVLTEAMIRPLVRQMLIMRGTSLHVQGRTALGQHDWALVKAACAPDEVALYSLIIDTYQHMAVRGHWSCGVHGYLISHAQACHTVDSDNSTVECDPYSDTASSENTPAAKRQKIVPST